ncbi:hypothetical protein SAMN05216326_11851 [Nitrosomonas marina]|uniref:Uncharacterized protein n=1 Tax=Nitrosomonas marina TaxID=917 RepID=A0A1I0D5U9_9PROT|nr:hypothetical protein SAMN05216326_11851 [Nitrosomonas marina]
MKLRIAIISIWLSVVSLIGVKVDMKHIGLLMALLVVYILSLCAADKDPGPYCLKSEEKAQAYKSGSEQRKDSVFLSEDECYPFAFEGGRKLALVMRTLFGSFS